jgi:hypothetical protein
MTSSSIVTMLSSSAPSFVLYQEHSDPRTVGRRVDRSMIFNADLVETLELDNMLAQACVSLHLSARSFAATFERSFLDTTKGAHVPDGNR